MADSKWECSTCSATTTSGERCKRKTCKTGPYCWMHGQIKLGLRVKDSTLPNAGNGLFVVKKKKDDPKVIFEVGDKICDYRGKMRKESHLDLKEKGGKRYDYLVGSGNKVVDGSKTNSSLGRYANDAGPAKRNAEIVATGRGKNTRYELDATKNIRDNSEVFVSYGRKYWSGVGGRPK